MRFPAAIAAALALSACSQDDRPAAPAYAALDCAQPFEAQAAALLAQPLNAAPKDPGEPYRFYSSPDGRTSYVVTEPGAPGHPAIVLQQSGDAGLSTTGCAYGDKAGYEQLRSYVAGLAKGRGG